jgi:hypothetical protein
MALNPKDLEKVGMRDSCSHQEENGKRKLIPIELYRF